jgi:hypothetical protein
MPLLLLPPPDLLNENLVIRKIPAACFVIVFSPVNEIFVDPIPAPFK